MPIYLNPYNDLDRYTRERILDEHREVKIIITAFLVGIMAGIAVGFLLRDMML